MSDAPTKEQSKVTDANPGVARFDQDNGQDSGRLSGKAMNQDFGPEIGKWPNCRQMTVKRAPAVTKLMVTE